MHNILRRDLARQPSDAENFYLGEKEERDSLVEAAIKKLETRRYHLRLLSTEALSKREFIETLNCGILCSYSVRYRREKNNPAEYWTGLDSFIKKIADIGNLGIFPDAEERHEILHPPFESFARNLPETTSVDDPQTRLAGSAVVAIEGNVVFADFRPTIDALQQQNAG